MKVTGRDLTSLTRYLHASGFRIYRVGLGMHRWRLDCSQHRRMGWRQCRCCMLYVVEDDQMMWEGDVITAEKQPVELMSWPSQRE